MLAAVSGGPDSLALAFLLRAWGDPAALVVDHGLRPDSAAEAAETLRRLAAMGVPARAVRLRLLPGGDLGARARAARYDALLAACRAEGRPDLFLGHHGRDQAETLVLRARAGSGPAGLAGMAAASWRDGARLLRPFLPLHPERLRATLRAAGIGWAEDPGNTDPATARGALRASPPPAVPGLAPPPLGAIRREAEAAVARELARRATLLPAGAALLSGALSPAALSAVVWTVSGRAHPPPPAAVRALAERGEGTLHGALLRRSLLCREPAAAAPPVEVRDGARWDGRFVVHGAPPGTALGALGNDAAAVRRLAPRPDPGLPAVVLRGLPCLRRGSEILAVPHLGYAGAPSCPSLPFAFRIEWRPARPAAGGLFRP